MSGIASVVAPWSLIGSEPSLAENEALFASAPPMMWSRLRSLGFRERRVPEEYRFRVGRNGVALETAVLRHPLGTEVRGAYLRSAKVEIVNMMGYPADAEQVPVFALQWVAFNGLPRVAVLDLQSTPHSALLNELEAMLGEDHRLFSSLLTPAGDAPEWARECFSPVCLWTRPQSRREVKTLHQAFQRYLEVWTGHYLARESGHFRNSRFLAGYCRHHAENTPARPFLHTAYGEEWAERFIHDFLYSLG